MIAPGDPYLEAFAKAGADIITVHAEAGPHLHRSLQAIRALGKKAGVTLNPGTPVSTIEHVIDIVDLILVMTVNPGFGGQSLHSGGGGQDRAAARADRRPADRHRGRRRRHARTCAALVAGAGANVLVAGSAVFKGGEAESGDVNATPATSPRSARRPKPRGDWA